MATVTINANRLAGKIDHALGAWETPAGVNHFARPDMITKLKRLATLCSFAADISPYHEIDLSEDDIAILQYRPSPSESPNEILME